VDYGTHRVGLAVTDPFRLFAQPLGTFSPEEAVAQLKTLHAREGLAAVVVGWPLTETGEEGVATRRVTPYLGRLRNALPGVAVVTQDERYTTRRASEAFVESGVRKRARRRAKQTGRLDAAAAAVILQDYLDDADV
jgi:putative Holliday junction resolvase